MKKLNLSGWGLLSLLTIVGLTGNAFGQSETLWTHTVQGNINWLQVAPTGHLIVSTKESLVGVDPENGEILWTREDLKGLKERPAKFDSWLQEFIPYTPYAVLRKNSEAGKTFKHEGAPIYINVINTVTGEDIVTTEAMGLRDQYGYFLLPKIGGMLIFALDKDKKQTVIAVELQTGKVIWKNKDSFKFDFFDPDVDADPGSFVPRSSEQWQEVFDKAAAAKYAIPDNQPPLFDTEESMITFMTKKGIRKFSSKTGELIWETKIKAKHAPYLTYGYAAMLFIEKDKVIYAASDKTVYAVRTEDGSLLWEKAP
ncbi:MAG: PQQ-binding-like beta-propeller repeat protein, partial [Candidatus Poribacteria bacterium]